MLPLLASLCFSCAEPATSQTSQLTPELDSFVVTGKYTFANELWRRFSLIMPKGSIELYSLDGTSIVDMVGLSTTGKIYEHNDWEHIKRTDFKALKLVKIASTNAYDLVEYESDRKVGKLTYRSSSGDYILSELCTGSAETLCSFSFDKEKNSFDIKFLPQPEVDKPIADNK